MRRYSLRFGISIGAFLIAGCSVASNPGSSGQSLTPFGGARGPRAATGTTYPTSKTLIFEGAYNSGTSPYLINIYDAGKIKRNPAPIATITDSLDDPYALAMDSSGTLYVANSLNSTVTEYPRGQTTHDATITDGLDSPDGLAIDSSGTLYVANYYNSSGGNTGYISEYAPGSTSPSGMIAGFNGILDEETIDKKGNLYLAWHHRGSGSPTVADVVEVPKGTTKIKHLNLKGIPSPLNDLAIDSSGRLWVTYCCQPDILIYKLPGKKPVQTIHNKLMPQPYWISVDANGTVFVDVTGDSKVGSSVDAFKPGAGKPYARLTNTVYFPYGLLVAKP